MEVISLFIPAISCSRSNSVSYQSTGSAARSAWSSSSRSTLGSIGTSSPLLVEMEATQAQVTGSESASNTAEIRWSFVSLPGTKSGAERFKSDCAGPTRWNKFGGSSSCASSPSSSEVLFKPCCDESTAEVPSVCWTGNGGSPWASGAWGSTRTSVSSPRPLGSQGFAWKSSNKCLSTCSETGSLRMLLVLNTPEVVPTTCMSAEVSLPSHKPGIHEGSALGCFPRSLHNTTSPNLQSAEV